MISYSIHPPSPGSPIPPSLSRGAGFGGGGAPKKGTLAVSGKPGLPPPGPLYRGVYEKLLELPPRPAPPAPRTRRQSETSVPHLAAPTLAPRPPRPPPPPCLPGAGAPAWPPVT